MPVILRGDRPTCPRQERHRPRGGWQNRPSFLVISGLGRLGWPTAGWGIALALVIVGGGIELLQGMPFIDRDMNFLDWLADSVGVLAGILGADAAMRIATACGIATMLRAFGASAPTSGGLMR